jgi:hypothetical protein
MGCPAAALRIGALTIADVMQLSTINILRYLRLLEALMKSAGPMLLIAIQDRGVVKASGYTIIL